MFGEVGAGRLDPMRELRVVENLLSLRVGEGT
jgi:hypothetical protein